MVIVSDSERCMIVMVVGIAMAARRVRIVLQIQCVVAEVV